MRLTSFSDYGLRVLMLLGLRGGALVTIREMAQSYAVSENHLLKVVQTLAKLGYVEPVRGRSGGIRLTAKPGEIRLGEVVRQLESDFALVDCMDEQRRAACVISSACRLQKPLARAMEAFLDVLDEYTLADLLYHPQRLKSLLAVEKTPEVRVRGSVRERG